MQLIFLDFETYYSTEYSLRKMTPVEYVKHPLFQVIGCAIQYGYDGDPFWLEGYEFGEWLKTQDPRQCIFVSHNALFDMAVMAWHYNFVPALMIDTMGMSRAMLQPYIRRMSLASVSEYLGLPAKGDCIHKVKGMTLDQIKCDADLYAEYQAYARRDVNNCAGIFKHCMDNGFPKEELYVMDMVIRCCVQPQFLLDANVLCEHLNEVQQEKGKLLAQACLLGANGKADLMSNDRFAKLLEERGVEVPRKISPVTQRVAFAFAKTDNEFLELQEHPDIGVQVLVAARLNHKSTIEETRCQRLLSLSRLPWIDNPHPEGNPMPVPLRYSGAHTHRLSGDWSMNMQNLPRGGALRRAIVAPKYHKVITVDSAQVEARGVATFCGQLDLIDAFAEGRDVYSEFAAGVFERPVTKADVPERFVGKTAILGLGYGLGHNTFQARIKSGSQAMLGQAITMELEEAKRVVDTYRRTYPGIPTTWRWLNDIAIPAMVNGQQSVERGPVTFMQNKVLLPNGLYLYYHNLRHENGEYWFKYGEFPKKLYGGKLLENIIQALARIIVMQAALRIKRRTKLNLALQAHDELVYVVHDDNVEAVKAILLEEMTRPVAWLPQWPLGAEVGVGQSYGEAK